MGATVRRGFVKCFPMGAILCLRLAKCFSTGAGLCRRFAKCFSAEAIDMKSPPPEYAVEADGCPRFAKWFPTGADLCRGLLSWGGFAPYPPHPFLVLIQEKGAKENQAPTGGGEAGRVRDGAIEMVSGGGGFVPGAIVMGGFAPYPPHPFLVMIQEKGAKENQAPTGGRETCRVRDGAIEMVSDGGRFVPGAIVVRGFASYLLHPFLVLIQEKGAKENQAPTGGGEAGRVWEGGIEMVSDGGDS